MLNLSVRHAQPFVSVDEVKDNLRVSTNDEDTLISRLVDTACQYVQEQSGKRLNADTYTDTLANFPYLLPLKPVSAVSQVQYYDVDNVSQTTTDYRFLNEEDSPRLLPLENQEWPVVYDRYDAVTVTFTTGYPATMLFPENLKHAAIMLASHWYENRTPAGLKMDEIPHGVESLINLSKVGWYV